MPPKSSSAIDRGVAYLKREQQPRGNWAEFPGYDGGVTALCTLALLNSGVPVDDPACASEPSTIFAASSSTKPTPSRCKRWSSAPPTPSKTCSASAAT